MIKSWDGAVSQEELLSIEQSHFGSYISDMKGVNCFVNYYVSF